MQAGENQGYLDGNVRKICRKAVLGLEPVRRTARPSFSTAVSGYGWINPSRLLGSEIEKCTGPARPVRTRPFRRVVMYSQIMLRTLRRPAYTKYLMITNSPGTKQNPTDCPG
jgi:hypothetical protein